jgi:hypothetical protein
MSLEIVEIEVEWVICLPDSFSPLPETRVAIGAVSALVADSFIPSADLLTQKSNKHSCRRRRSSGWHCQPDPF